MHMQATRQHDIDDFAKAWVRVVAGSIVPPAISSTVAVQASVEEPARVLADSAAPVVSNETIAPVETFQTAPPVDQPAVPSGEGLPSTTANDEAQVGDESAVFLSLFNGTNNRIVLGNVDVIDPDRTKKLTQVPGNDYVTLPDPRNKSKELTLVCEVFGYRKIQHDISYPLTLADTTRSYVDLMGNTMVVKFDLVRYHRGDIATLFNVYFFNDAAIMRPESKYQLEELLQMLKENSHYKILLHGHTNGHYHGRILTMGENKNLFSLEGSRSGVGSAKDLSYSRAAVIKAYLSENGIDESRVAIKAWGGKRPIFDKHGVNAKKNVRVEVEILAD